jgi:hypothetical protein
MAASPLVTDAGLALMETVGAGVGAFTVTLTDLVALPPVPVQLRLKVLVALRTPLDWLPEVALVPDQAPDAVHDVALVDDHDRVLEAPLATEVGLALSETVGAGAVTDAIND